MRPSPVFVDPPDLLRGALAQLVLLHGLGLDLVALPLLRLTGLAGE
jgi:hypothetical protein